MVARTLESYAVEQLPQLVIAPLDIANRIGRHTTLEARVETSILYRFRDMLGSDGGAGCKVRNGASDTQHAVIRARREQEAGERMPQELIAVPVGRAMTVYLTRAEEGIGFVLARKLRLVCLRHPAANSARCFAGHRRHQLGFARRRHFQLDVDAIGKRPRHATTITGDAFGSAAAAAGTVAAMPARAGVHRRNELKTRWKLRLAR